MIFAGHDFLFSSETMVLILRSREIVKSQDHFEEIGFTIALMNIFVYHLSFYLLYVFIPDLFVTGPKTIPDPPQLRK